MKNKNPLYVVKGKDVEEAASVFDLVIKKFNLQPAITVIRNLFFLLLEMVESFAMYQAVKNFIEEMIEKTKDLGKRAGILYI